MSNSNRTGRPRWEDLRRRAHRTIENIRTNGASAENMAELHQAGQQLQTALSHSRALIEQPLPVPNGSRSLEREYAEEAETNRAFKRRRLDGSPVDRELKRFSYGHYGQVEPGKLKMEIESCDGGMYGEPGADYSASNVLKNDDSVYCTKDNRCNLVLRHQGATPFCLQELVIKAPKKGFTAPVQEGMIFVAMSADNLLARTAQYVIRYSPIRRSISNTIRPNSSIRYDPDGNPTTSYDLAPTPPERSYRLAQIPSDFQTPTSQLYQVTTSCSDDEDDVDDTTHVAPGRRRIRVRSAPRFLDPDEDTTDSDHDLNVDSDGSIEPDPGRWRHDAEAPVTGNAALLRMAERYAAINEEEQAHLQAHEQAQERADERANEQAQAGDLMAPRAKFFIEQGKNKCTIRFDPPVSGRFVLLKTWSPRHRPCGNIDIQSVTVKGFAGPRFFPAQKSR